MPAPLERLGPERERFPQWKRLAESLGALDRIRKRSPGLLVQPECDPGPREDQRRLRDQDLSPAGREQSKHALCGPPRFLRLSDGERDPRPSEAGVGEQERAVRLGEGRIDHVVERSSRPIEIPERDPRIGLGDRRDRHGRREVVPSDRERLLREPQSSFAVP